MVDRVGQQLGNYRLVSLLGQGGYAEVYLGQHVRLNQKAAIKVLYAHLTEAEAEHFQQEAQTIATLVHPGIVRVFDYDVQDGVPFLVIDYAPGGTLRRHYPKGSLVPLPVIISLVKQVADALQYAHEQKFIHRDVKPENMLLGRRQEVLISDFGIATIAHSTSSLNVGSEGASGTLAYMAPEQIEGHPREASDQYALGVVVYEWLCGERPFEGSGSEIMAQHLSLSPPPLHERMSSIPLEVEQVVLQALSKDPKARFASVQDYALALEGASTAASTGSTRPMLASGYNAEARHTTKHHLPVYLTPLLGREQEIVVASAILRRPEVRLVTLTGTGGIGKTRLAVQVATELVADFAGGVSFVSLAPISDPELAIPTIAQTLDVKESGTLTLMDLLKAYLQDKQVLLILDNFEQLLPAAPHLTDLLGSCPGLNLLVTSRAVLHVQGEQEFPVPPLVVPDLTQLPSPEVLSHSAAVALFLQRAQTVKPTFGLTPANARLIAEICTHLDGLPLAIELAAARIKLLSPQALLSRLEHRLAVLTGGTQDAPRRQQTLRNTIDWSYDLLSAPEQQFFRRLSVFVGGCTLQAIESVYAALKDGAGQVLDGVASLLDKSLLQQTELEGEEPRITMLETVREYGLECLRESVEAHMIQRAHALYYLALAEEAEPHLQRGQQVVWLERLEHEHNNLRAAMQWGLSQSEDRHGREMALRSGGALRRFWIMHGHWTEGRSLLKRALAESKGVAASVRAKALITAANLANMQSDNDQAEALAEESLALCRELGDTQGIALSLRLLGVAAARRGRPAAARSLNEEALALFRKSGDNEGAAWSLFNLAWRAIDQGEYARGRALLEESLTLHRELGNKWGIAILLHSLANVLFDFQGDRAIVRSLLEESLALSREVGDKQGIASSLVSSGRLALSQSDAATANSLAEESLALNREIGSPGDIAESLWLLARVASVQGDYTIARSLYEQSLAIAKEGNKWDIAFYLEGLAEVVAAQGELAWAAQIWGAAEFLREVIGAPIPPVERTDYERAVATARAHFGEKAFAAVWAEGRTMTPEQALVAHVQGTIPVPATEGLVSSSPTKSPASSPAGLSSREAEVLRLVAQGMTNEQVAEQLAINLSTVKAHMRSIYNKLGINSRSAVTRYAIEHQLA